MKTDYSINDIWTQEDRMNQFKAANRKLLTDSWHIAFMLAVVLVLGFAMGWQVGFREGAESMSAHEYGLGCCTDQSGKVPAASSRSLLSTTK